MRVRERERQIDIENAEKVDCVIEVNSYNCYYSQGERERERGREKKYEKEYERERNNKRKKGRELERERQRQDLKLKNITIKKSWIKLFRISDREKNYEKKKSGRRNNIRNAKTRKKNACKKAGRMIKG